MPHKMLKLSTLAILVAGASQASAAVYTIQPIEQNSTLVDQPYPVQSDRSLTYVSTGIESSGTDESCFTTECKDNSYKVTGQALRGSQGKPLQDTVAYNANDQQANSEDSLWRYCDYNLGYQTCQDWAKREFFGLDFNDDDEFNAPGLGGLQKKSAAWVNGYSSNSQGLVDGSPVTTFASDLTKYHGSQTDKLGSFKGSAEESTDSTVNGVVGDFVYGITSSALFTNSSGNPRAFDKRGFVNAGGNDIALDPVAKDESPLVSNMGQTQANAGVLFNDKLLVVGSSAYSPSFYEKDANGGERYDESKLPSAKDILNTDTPSLDFNDFKACTNSSTNLYASWECQFSTFANEAAFWLVDANGEIKSGSISSGTGAQRDGLAVFDSDNDSLSFQASAKSVALVNGSPLAAGYSTSDVNGDFYAMQAAYFTADNAELTSWKRTFVPGLSIKPGDDRDFTYTIANAVNNQSMIVGDAKGNGQKPLRAYVYKVGAPNAEFLDQLAPSLFFKNSNSHASAVNNHDQVVGWVDVSTETKAERRHRAFSYMADTAQGPLAAKKAWLLDDLTNDGKQDSNANKYRIINATGVNDAGVISATALYCENGYDNTSQSSFCNGGETGAEKYVSVKLTPINGAKESDIIVRKAQDDEPVKRSGGSLGILALTALGFIGFRRRK
ncbi:hypothetical protein SKA34_13895 [Photobacterium sp. SKA34]|uniref:DUF3466 family protein n=1 Tax=Photobacterium sp. SKA34 TaxID=121723 RepID=UPI00006B34D6|nr:DUF3466 family protein [Photobacterium sp. SKA34]EAR53654.1 hypothetical protein SKA34_13895 [Photobacterium sp. SKA34]